MTNLENLLTGGFALEPPYLWQKWITQGFKRLCNQRRTDEACGMAGHERDHAAATTLRHRQRKQRAYQIDDIIEVVVKAYAFGRIGTHACAIFISKLRWPADAGVEAGIFRLRRSDNPLSNVGLYQG